MIETCKSGKYEAKRKLHFTKPILLDIKLQKKVFFQKFISNESDAKNLFHKINIHTFAARF